MSGFSSQAEGDFRFSKIDVTRPFRVFGAWVYQPVGSDRGVRRPVGLLLPAVLAGPQSVSFNPVPQYPASALLADRASIRKSVRPAGRPRQL